MLRKTVSKRLSIAILLAVFFLSGCGKNTDQETDKIIKKKVRVQGITLQNEVTSSLKVSGTVVPKEYSVIRSLTPGTVMYLAPVGSEISVGQPLFSLSDAGIESSYFNANQSFEQTRVISNQKVVQAELALNGAKARLDLARSQYDSTLAQTDQALKVAEDSAMVAYSSAYNSLNQIILFLSSGSVTNDQYQSNKEGLYYYKDLNTSNSQLKSDVISLFPSAVDSFLALEASTDSENLTRDLGAIHGTLLRVKSLVDNTVILIQSAIIDENFNALRASNESIIVSGFQAQINQNISTIINSINAITNTLISNRLSIEQSQSQMDLSQIDYNNSELSLLNAREGAQLEQSMSQSQLDQASYNYRNLNLPSPFSGTILSHYVSEGEQVSPGRELVELGNLSIVEISVDVDVIFAKNIKVNDELMINGKYKGIVSEVEPVGDLSSGNVSITVQSAEAQAELSPSSIAEVEFKLIYKDVNSIVIPMKSVNIESSGNYVYVVSADNKVERKNVVLGQVYSEKVSVISGLAEGDKLVILDGVFVSSGDEVEIIE